MKNQKLVLTAVEAVMPVNELMFQIKTGRAGEELLLDVASRIRSVPDEKNETNISLDQLLKLLGLMSVSFFAKCNRYKVGTGSYRGLEVMYQELVMSVLQR